MVETSPNVTVILPTFNAGDFLRPAVESILGQTYRDFELLLIDDGSTDDSVESLASSTETERLRIIRQPNLGLAATLNRGLHEARGKLIARMDADDIADKDRLRSQADRFLTQPDLVLLGGQIRRVAEGHVLSISNFPCTHTEILNGLLNRAHVLSHPAVMYRREAAIEVGGYWTTGLSEDWDLFLKLSDVGSLANLPDPVLDYRYHVDSINSRTLREVRTNIRLAIENHNRRRGNKPELTPAEFQKSLTRTTRMALQAEIASLSLYRSSLSHRAQGHAVRARACLAVCVALWPRQALRRLKSKTFRRREHQRPSV